MCTSYTARYICILSLQYIWISSGLSRCLVPTPGLTSEYPTCRVSSAPPNQFPLPDSRHLTCVLIIHVCLCVCAYVCACENV